ncbi:hypothetical protein [Streptacidiphilus sp. EB129]|uniref:hypothetical protein n=1 Tax=Streptacidiphilus sp. EB129 TaxID=3156262 RepID=UPI003512C5E0
MTSAAAPGTDVALRASVLARAGVGVLRATRLTYTALPEPGRAATDLGDLVRRGFAALDVRPGSAGRASGR